MLCIHIKLVPVDGYPEHRCPRIVRRLEEGGGVSLPRCPRHAVARCPRVVPRLEEGGGVSLPRCPRLARRLEEGGRVSLPVTVVGTVGSSDRNCGKKYDFDNGSNIHQ